METTLRCRPMPLILYMKYCVYQFHLAILGWEEPPVPAVVRVLFFGVVVHPLAEVVGQVEGAVVVRAVLVVDRDHTVLQLLKGVNKTKI